MDAFRSRRRFRSPALAPAGAADKPYDGVTLTLASQNDQFGTVMADLAPKFKEATGITVKVDILSYPELLTKVTADFVGHTKGYDLRDDGHRLVRTIRRKRLHRRSDRLDQARRRRDQCPATSIPC